MARTHGTRSTYVHGCRCSSCTEANRVYHRALVARLGSQTIPEDDPRHGTVTAYTNWKCRCAPCKAAGAAKNRLRYT